MVDAKAVFGAIVSYVRAHPDEVLRVLKNLVALRLGVPLPALQWVLEQPRKKGPTDIVIEAVPPGVRFSGSIDLMKTPVRAEATLFVEQLDVKPDALRIELRVADIQLRVLSDASDTAVAALLRSGALDLSKPGNLLAYMPQKPAMLVEAQGDRIVIDLYKHPKIANNARLKKAITLIEPVVTLGSLRTNDAHLDLELRAFPRGFSTVVQDLKERVLRLRGEKATS